MLYSSNRVSQFFVVKKVATDAELTEDKKHLKKTAPAGTILVKKTDGCMYFEYMSPGGPISSDHIMTGRVGRVSVADGVSQCRRLAAKVIRMADVKGSGNDTDGSLKDQALPGQNYRMTVKLGGYLGLDELDNYLAQAYVRGRDGMTNSEFYVRLAHSLALNISSLPDPMLRVLLMKGKDEEVATEIAIENGRVRAKLDALLNDGVKYTGIMLRERVEDNYVQGKGEPIPLIITIQSDHVVYQETEVAWCEDKDAAFDRATAKVYGVGGVTEATAEAVSNGRRTCDEEYWCMGERGDQERKYGWPNNTDTKYMADPSQVYDYLNIHFFWVGSHEEVQRSERDLIIVTPHYADVTAAKPAASGVMNALVEKMNATGVVTLPTI